MINADMINKAFAKREQIFDDLSVFEDEQMALEKSQGDYVKGSNGWNDIQKKIVDGKVKHNTMHRQFVKINWEIDRLNMLTRVGGN